MEIRSYYIKTDQGPYLQVNEDGIIDREPLKLFAVLDGFGGGSLGTKATKLATENIVKFYQSFGEDPDSTMPFFYSAKYLIEGNALINAALNAHEQIWDHFSGSDDYGTKGGASALVAAQSENTLSLLSTGNAIAFLYRKGYLECLMRPDCHDFQFNDSMHSPMKTFPLSGLGMRKELAFELKEVRIHPGDLFLMMTDGVYSRLRLVELQHYLRLAGEGLSHLGNQLINHANENGNLDNQSLAIIQY